MRGIDRSCIHCLEDETTFKCNSLSTLFKYRLPPSAIECLSALIQKPNNLEATNFCCCCFFFLSKEFVLSSSARLSSLNLKAEELTGCGRSSSSVRGASGRLSALRLLPVIHSYCWIEMSWGAFTPANRDVCTRPGGLGLVGWTVLLLPPQATNTKKSTSPRLISLAAPPLYSKGFKSQCWLHLPLA